MKHLFGDARTVVECVVAVHQYFGLDDRHQSLFLADGGVARQSMRIRGNRACRWDVGADANHRAPFGEAGTQLLVITQSLA